MWSERKGAVWVLGQYVKHHRKSLGLMALFAVLFLVVLALYSLPLEAVLYWVVLCLFFGGVAVGIDFYHYLKRHRELLRLRKEITLGVLLPEPNNLIEWDYTALIDILNREKLKITQDSEQRAKEMADYYTLWAHQIKTPIAALRLLMQARQDCSEMGFQLFKIEQYVEMVLQYMRFESDYTDYRFKKQDLGGIVRQAARKFAPMFVGKRLALHLGESWGKVVTDEKWICFVIEQILSNAVKYTEEGSVSIYMEEGNALVIADTGIGIARRTCRELGSRALPAATAEKARALLGWAIPLQADFAKAVSPDGDCLRARQGHDGENRFSGRGSLILHD